MSEFRTAEVILKDGYIDKSGALHKRVIMRALKTKDQIAFNSDLRVKQLKNNLDSLTVNVSEMSVKRDGTGGVTVDGNLNPTQLQLLEFAMAEFNSILLPHVVLSIGDIQRPDQSVFKELSTLDMAILQHLYSKLNEIKPEDLEGEKENSPLES